MVKILFGLGVAMLVLSAWVALNNRAFNASPIRVEAVVEETHPGKKTPDRRILPANLTLKYTYEGIECRPTVNALDKHWVNLKPGERVRLVILPSDPTRFVAEASLPKSAATNRLAIFFLVLGLSLIGLSQIRGHWIK